MKPFYFGLGNRRLFGVYSPACSPGSRNRAVVLCHPWGQEYLRAHRSMRQLASALAIKGVHVLRFDYFGTGDSGGDMVDADLHGWVADICSAIDEVQDMVGAVRVDLVGLRLGAALASLAAVERIDQVDRVVLWDPILSGRSYLEELYGTKTWSAHGSLKPVSRPAHSGGGLEILGFPMTAAMIKDLQSLEIQTHVRRLAYGSLVVVTDPISSPNALQCTFDNPDSVLTLERIPALPAWLEDQDSGAGAVPVKVIQRIVQWLE